MSSLIYLAATVAVILTGLKVIAHIVKFRLFHLFVTVAKIGVMLDLVLCASTQFSLVHPFVRSICARINFENDRNINK